MIEPCLRGLGAAFAFCGTMLVPVLADEAPVTIELNKLEPVTAETCRAYVVVTNPGTRALTTLRLDLFAFDQGGVIAKRAAVDVAPVAAAKTVVKLFDFAGVPCSQFSRMLLNDVIACDPGPSEAKARCIDGVQTASKVDTVVFDK